MNALKIRDALVLFSAEVRPSPTTMGEFLGSLSIPWKTYADCMTAMVHVRGTNRLACLKCERMISARSRMPFYNDANIRAMLSLTFREYEHGIEKVLDESLSGIAYDVVLPLRDLVTLKLMSEPQVPQF